MSEYKNLELTPLKNEGGEMGDTCDDYSTAGLVEYCLRSGCLDSEYYLALRMQKLRAVALRLAEDIVGYGGDISQADLEIIDVVCDVTSKNRIFTNED